MASMSTWIFIILKRLFLLAFILKSPICLEASLEISGSSSYALLNESFTFTCTVTDAASLVDRIQFFRNSTDVFTSVYQNMATCSPVIDAPFGYELVCGSGTTNSSSTTKNYSVVIHRTADLDATGWWCEQYTALLHSNTIVLPVFYGPQNVALDHASPGNVTEGDSLTVNCMAQCNPSPCSFLWTLGNNGVSPGALLSLTDISITVNGSVYTCTVNNSAIPRSTTIQFTLTVNPKSTSSPATTSNSATTSTIPSQSPTTTTKPTPTDWLFYVYIAAGVVGAVVFGIIVICCCRCHKVCCFKNSNESHDSPEDNKSQPYTNNVYAVVKKRDKERPESDVSYKSTCGFVDIDLNPSNPPTALQSGLPKSDPSQPVSRAPRGNPLHDDIDLPSYKSSSRGPKNKSDDNEYTFYTGQGGTSDRPGEKAYDRLHVGERGYEGSGERGYEMLGEGGKVTGREYANVKKSEGLARL